MVDDLSREFGALYGAYTAAHTAYMDARADAQSKQIAANKLTGECNEAHSSAYILALGAYEVARAKQDECGRTLDAAYGAAKCCARRIGEGVN